MSMPRPATTPALDVEDLVQASLRILRDYGLADLSMRRVAKELQVQPSALYWHVPDKQSLLALVADRLLSEVRTAGLTGDRTIDVHGRATALHGCLLATRDGAELVASVVALGTGGRRVRILLEEAAPGQAVLVEAVLSLLLGHALVVQQRRQAQELGLAPAGGAADGPAGRMAEGPGFPDLLDLVLGPPAGSAPRSDLPA